MQRTAALEMRLGIGEQSFVVTQWVGMAAFHQIGSASAALPTLENGVHSSLGTVNIRRLLEIFQKMTEGYFAYRL